MEKYLGEFGGKMQRAREKSASQSEFIENLISELGEEDMLRLNERIKNDD